MGWLINYPRDFTAYIVFLSRISKKEGLSELVNFVAHVFILVTHGSYYRELDDI
jgi:hypothetical protein